MQNAIICAVDECDLRQNKYAYNRIKDWITGGDILIHQKGETPFMVKNIAHFIHTGNDPNELQVFGNDSRIVVIRVPPLDPMDMIPQDTFFTLLDKEAPAFLGTLFHIEIPPCTDRLNIPVIDTEEKQSSIELSKNAFQLFLSECCHFSPGESVRYNDLWVKFQEWLDPNEVMSWTKIQMGRSLPSQYPKGRLAKDGAQFHVGNISFTQPETLEKYKYVINDGFIVMER
jgi:hypothetical protein